MRQEPVRGELHAAVPRGRQCLGMQNVIDGNIFHLTSGQVEPGHQQQRLSLDYLLCPRLGKAHVCEGVQRRQVLAMDFSWSRIFPRG